MIYIETLDTVYFERYIVIKSFGKSAARILDLTFTSKLDTKNDIYQLGSLVGGIISWWNHCSKSKIHYKYGP